MANRALLVGINKYRIPGADLNGCVNDATNVRRDNQTSEDAFIKGSYNGAFSYYFCKHLRETEAVLIRGELLKRVRASLRHNGFSQVPQLECPRSGRKKKLLD